MTLPPSRLPASAEKMIHTKVPVHFRTLLQILHRRYPLKDLITDLRSLVSIAFPLHHPWITYCRLVLLYRLQYDTHILLREAAHHLHLHLSADVVDLYRRFSAMRSLPSVSIDILLSEVQDHFQLDLPSRDLVTRLVKDPNVAHLLPRHRVAGAIWHTVKFLHLTSPALTDICGWSHCGRSTVYAICHRFTALLPPLAESAGKKKKGSYAGGRVVSPKGTIVYRYREIQLDGSYASTRVTLYTNRLTHSLDIYFGETCLLQVPDLHPNVYHRTVRSKGMVTFHYHHYQIDARYEGMKVELSLLPSGDEIDVSLRGKQIGHYYLK